MPLLIDWVKELKNSKIKKFKSKRKKHYSTKSLQDSMIQWLKRPHKYRVRKNNMNKSNY